MCAIKPCPLTQQSDIKPRELVEVIGGWLDGSRKREAAMKLVHSARDYDRQIQRAEREARVLRVNAKQVGMGLTLGKPRMKTPCGR